MLISNPISEYSIFTKRVIFAGLIMMTLTGILIYRFFNLQIINYSHYKQESIDNQIITRSVPPIRGRIFDRNGAILADNKLSYILSIIPEKTNGVSKTITKLKQDNFINDADIKKYYKIRKYYNSFDDIIIAYDMPYNAVAKVLSSQDYKGINVRPYFKRIYPKKGITTHIIGYVNRISNDKKSNKKYQGITHIGKTGLEKQYDDLLLGTAGLSKITRNALGRSISTDIVKYPKTGNDLYLSIDYRLQEKAQELLHNKRGSVVMMFVKTGEILALASAPTFDANSFVNGISNKDYKKLINDKNRPLFNRAIRGVYPPGSTIKPFVALAGLENNVIKKDKHIFCKGSYNLPNNNHKYRDWKKSGHGNIDLKASIAQSCDVFFYELAYELGIDKIHNYLAQFNIGSKTKIDLPNENYGVLPSKKWKKRIKNKPWYIGETIIAGIGQGFMGTTPLQLTVSTGALASGGKLTTPRLLKRISYSSNTIISTEAIFKQLNIVDIKNYETVIDGMKQTIYSPKGTARRLNKNLQYTLAGKTGTAQVFSLSKDESYNAKNIAEHLRDHALFTSFAPIDNPEVVIAVVVENAGSGSANAAPIARKMLDLYFNVVAKDTPNNH